MTPLAAGDRTADTMVDLLTARLADPVPSDDPWAGQSLAEGAAGTALLHIERALTGLGSWEQAHRWIAHSAEKQISAADTTGLFLGVPALAFVLHTAAADSSRYTDARRTLHGYVTALAHRRVDTALERIHRRDLTTFTEYDVFYGLTGIGAYLLRSAPGGGALERVLDYLVALTRPLTVDGRRVPGWWVAHDPHRQNSARFPGGHGNLGTAHGITGPLMLLSQATRRGIEVDGQTEAIATILAHLDRWQQDGDQEPWWPEHLTAHELRTGRTRQKGPYRPSWCYGTPGIARAGQLASIATADRERQHGFEDALDRCLSDTTQTDRITDAGLCHGWAGLYQTVRRAAADAASSALAGHLPRLADALVRHADVSEHGHGFLEGTTGTALALMTAARDTPPTSGWDACLLID
ncbi:lanthionine synthetase C family protein [Nocardiopsis dassonvillei]|uniref:lanthionine synthetase C family protein n=1 Tax=Nocardiopsis dassonvillei TaxID=2014 RepID=UPI0033DEDB56